jgi:hypothetical protein
MAAGSEKTGMDGGAGRIGLASEAALQKKRRELARRFVIFRTMGAGRNRASKPLELFVYGHPEEALDVICVLGVVALVPV